jgi:hypothetical protein
MSAWPVRIGWQAVLERHPARDQQGREDRRRRNADQVDDDAEGQEP